MRRRQFHTRILSAVLGASLPLVYRSALSAVPPTSGGFPRKTIKMVVPYPAGGIVDTVARIVSNPLSQELSQRIVIENRPGADGRIGLDLVARADPDGYTLLAASPLLTSVEHLMPDTKARAEMFTGICGIAATPAVFVVHPDVPVQTMEAFVTHAKANPGALNVAIPGIGSSMHLALELFFEHTGIQLTQVHYKGQPPSLVDLAPGRVQFALISQNLILPMIQSGKVRPLAVSATARTQSLPNVPTIAEAGYPDALVQSWYGVAAPVQTPAAVLAWLDLQFQRTMGQPEVLSKLAALDADVMALDAAGFNTLIQKERQRLGVLIRQRNIRIQ